MESLKIAAQNPGMAERSALLAGSSHGAAASAGGGGGETQRSRDMTNHQMMAQFEKDTSEQDAILDEIGQGVDRIGVLGKHIGDETDAQQVCRGNLNVWQHDAQRKMVRRCCWMISKIAWTPPTASSNLVRLLR